MAVKVALPSGMRSQQEQQFVSVEAGTVREVVERVDAVVPGFLRMVLNSSNELRSSITLFVNGTAQGRATCETPIADGVRVDVVQAISGG